MRLGSEHIVLRRIKVRSQNVFGTSQGKKGEILTTRARPRTIAEGNVPRCCKLLIFPSFWVEFMRVVVNIIVMVNGI